MKYGNGLSEQRKQMEQMGDVVSERALRKILIELSIYGRGEHEHKIEAKPQIFFFVFPLNPDKARSDTTSPIAPGATTSLMGVSSGVAVSEDEVTGMLNNTYVNDVSIVPFWRLMRKTGH